MKAMAMDKATLVIQRPNGVILTFEGFIEWVQVEQSNDSYEEITPIGGGMMRTYLAAPPAVDNVEVRMRVTKSTIGLDDGMRAEAVLPVRQPQPVPVLPTIPEAASERAIDLSPT